MVRQLGKTTAVIFSTSLMSCVLLACDADPAEEEQGKALFQVPLKEIYQSQQCRVNEQKMRQLTSVQEVSQIKSPQLNLQGTEPAEAAVDFTKNFVVLVAQGQQTSAGFSVDLTSRKASVKSGRVQLPVTFNEPADGAFTAQVMTSPCVIVTFPKQTADGPPLQTASAGPLSTELNADIGVGASNR